MRRLLPLGASCLLVLSSARVALSEICSTLTASVSPSQQVDMADSGGDGCLVTVTWATAGSTTETIATEIFDVFIVLDESGSVGEENYLIAIDFVRNFIKDLDTSGSLFDSGGRIALTEFSWNPTDMLGDTSSEQECNLKYQVECYGQRRAPRTSPKYWIPRTGTFAYPNSYNISSDLTNALEVVDSMFYEPTGRDPQWPAYSLTCLGDAIKYTADMAQVAKNDTTREVPPARQAIGGPHTEGYDIDDYVLDLEDFANLDESFAEELVSRIVTACANNVEITAVVVGTPTSLVCEDDTCDTHGSTLTWNIAMLDDSLREMAYVVDACECGSVGGSLETLVNVSYSDDGTSPATHPLVPTSIAVDVHDASETCGVPSLTLVSTGVWTDGNGDGYANVDESITFTFEATNSGSKTLHNFCLTDSKLGSGCLDCTSLTALPGEIFSCDISYQVSQGDLDRGDAQTSATVSAESYFSAGESTEGSASATVDLTTLAVLEVVNNGVWTDVNLDGFPNSGEPLTYTITVKNAGTVTLEGVEVGGTSGAVTCLDDPQPVAVLVVGGSYECKMLHQITQAEINVGSVLNTATATASATTAPDGVTKAAPSTEPLARGVEMSLGIDGVWQDRIDSGNAGYADSTEIVLYTYTVSNTGNVDLTAVSVSDQTVDHNCGAATTLVAGRNFSCTGSSSLTWSDINLGVKTTIGTAVGTGPGTTGPTSATATVDVLLKPPPSIALGEVRGGAVLVGGTLTDV
ncbi:unnamed protein product, partial [Scytosiphon promiscuus]